MTLEILCLGKGAPCPPLLFIHGSFCGAWIWAEHFLPYFADAGWECLALSLRGHGNSAGRERLDQFGLTDYVADVAEAAGHLDRPPVVIGHSLGGMVAQRFACRHPTAGLVLLAPVGPGGLAGSFVHMALHHPGLLWWLGRMQTLGVRAVDFDLIRRALFSADFPAEESYRLLPLFEQRESQRANVELMIPQWLVLSPRPRLAVLVTGGDRDAFVPRTELAITAAFWNADLKVLGDVPHAMMLDTTWRQVAETLLAWLTDRF